MAILLLVILSIILISKHNKKAKKPKKAKSKDVKPAESKELEDTIAVSKKELEIHTKNETYLEKTIRFRRVCPKCGSINVITNKNCYLCGEELDKEK